MVTPELQQTSRRYGLAQTTLLCAYAGAVLLDHRPLLFASRGAAVVGDVLSGLGIAVLLIAVLTIRKAVQIAPEPKAGSQLMTAGIYRFLRHPIYTAIVVTTLGMFLKKPTMISLVAGGVVIAFLLIKVRFEEKLLLAVYPDYADYKKKVCGILPGW